MASKSTLCNPSSGLLINPKPHFKVARNPPNLQKSNAMTDPEFKRVELDVPTEADLPPITARPYDQDMDATEDDLVPRPIATPTEEVPAPAEFGMPPGAQQGFDRPRAPGDGPSYNAPLSSGGNYSRQDFRQRNAGPPSQPYPPSGNQAPQRPYVPRDQYAPPSYQNDRPDARPYGRPPVPSGRGTSDTPWGPNGGSQTSRGGEIRHSSGTGPISGRPRSPPQVQAPGRVGGAPPMARGTIGAGVRAPPGAYGGQQEGYPRDQPPPTRTRSPPQAQQARYDDRGGYEQGQVQPMSQHGSGPYRKAGYAPPASARYDDQRDFKRANPPAPGAPEFYPAKRQRSAPRAEQVAAEQPNDYPPPAQGQRGPAGAPRRRSIPPRTTL